MTHLRLRLRFLALACLGASVSPASAETFFLFDGSVIEGTAVRSVGSVLSIKLQGAGLERIEFDDVERIEIAAPGNRKISGRLLYWSKGIYRLLTDKGPLEATVKDGQVVALAGRALESAEKQTEPVAAAPVDVGGQEPPAAETQAQRIQTIKAGFVYVGPIHDAGRTFMHERGRQKLAENPLVDETAFIEIDSEDSDLVNSAIDRLVADGATVVFMTGNDSAAVLTESAERHENVRFVHCGPFDPAANIEAYCGRIYQARYLTGMIAGGMTKTNLIGYVAAQPVPKTVVEINAFALGVQSVKPDAQVIVHWTRSWYAPGDERRRAEDLVKRGVDILTIHQDSPAALQVAEQHGIGTIGYQSDMSAFAPSTILTSAIWNWGEMYDKIVVELNDGQAQLRPTWLGLRHGVVGLAPLSGRVPDDLQRLVQQRQREMIDGRFSVFTGPIRDVDGDVRILDGRIITDESLQAMDYLVQGVVGY